MGRENLSLEILDLEVLLVLVDQDRPTRILQRLGGNIRPAVNDLGQAEERTFRVLYSLDDVVAERGLSRLATEVVIGIPELAGLQRFRVFGGKLVEIDVDAFQIVEGKLLLQYSKGVRDDFNKDTKGNLTKAEANWPVLVEKKGE